MIVAMALHSGLDNCMLMTNYHRVVVMLVALAWLRGTIEVQDEMDEMRAENEQMKLVPKVTMREMIVNPTLRIPLTIAMVIMIAQQFSGINAVRLISHCI